MNRTDRLNSLLKQVISDVIRKDVKNPHVHELITVTRVAITKDLRHAKVYISVIADDQAKQETINALKSAASFIAVTASKQVVMRHFPELLFILDEGAENQLEIDKLLSQISEERKGRKSE